MKPGQLIVFEGPDGCGKTTLSKMLVTELHSRVRSASWQSFPGREAGTLGSVIYDIHHKPISYGITSISSSALQTLHLAAHLDAIECRIIPALKSGIDVVLDRFWWSMWAYGYVGSVNPDLLERLVEIERQHWGQFLPRVVFLLRRSTPFRRESPEAWPALNSAYVELAERERLAHQVQELWNEGTPADAMRQILATLG